MCSGRSRLVCGRFRDFWAAGLWAKRGHADGSGRAGQSRPKGCKQKMIEIVLIRPGSTDYDEQKRIQGTLDLPLSDQGQAEVMRMIDQLRQPPLETIFAAPDQAAWQTASTIAEVLGTRLKKVENLRNLDHGLWQGMLIDEVKRKQPKVFRQWQEQPETVCPPEGETLGEAQDRVQLSLCKVLKKQKT